MHIADMTMFYAPASGGVRTYLEAKHRHLWHYPGIRHSVLVPGASYRQANGIRRRCHSAMATASLSVAAPGARCCAICNRT